MKKDISVKSTINVVGIFPLLILLAFGSLGAISSGLFASETQENSTADEPDYCEDFSAFSSRFVRPPFPENASADDQKNWYALKKTCGRDLIKLSLSRWPSFDVKPEDVTDEGWNQFLASAELSRFHIAELIFDENHGGTLIKKYYSTDYEPDKIIALNEAALNEIANVEKSFAELTSDTEWKAARRCELDLFHADFSRWFIPYCRASLEKLPPFDEFAQNPDLFLTTADLLEFAVDFIPDDEMFISTLAGVEELLKAPKAVEIRVFHGRYEGFDLVSRDVIFARYCARIAAIAKKRSEKPLRPKLVDSYLFNGRQMNVYDHGTRECWRYENKEQIDRVFLLFPKDGPEENRPLYVALHSAGGSAETELSWRMGKTIKNIYLVPDDFYGFFVDCAVHRDSDWWWGGRRADEPTITQENASRASADLQPVERRVIDEVKWAIDAQKCDVNRVYLCGNSMGGSGTLGIGLRAGDLFAAIKANVPAGVWHAYDRLRLGDDTPPSDLVDPPVCLDYSAQNDSWSAYHEALFKGMEKRKYSYIAYWGAFGHANLDDVVAQYNDLFNTFPWTEIRKNEAYPVFTNASTDDPIPWGNDESSSAAGQRGAYFRWKNIVDSEQVFEIELRLASKEELNSKLFNPPTVAIADVSLRRLQQFKVEPKSTVSWSYSGRSGTCVAGDDGLITIPELEIAATPRVLKLQKQH